MLQNGGMIYASFGYIVRMERISVRHQGSLLLLIRNVNIGYVVSSFSKKKKKEYATDKCTLEIARELDVFKYLLGSSREDHKVKISLAFVHRFHAVQFSFS